MIVTVFITQRDVQHLASPTDDDGDDDGAPAGIE